MRPAALVCGAGGFIGHHLVTRLKREGYWVRGLDQKSPEFSESQADEFIVGDLRDKTFCAGVIDRTFSEVYQLAADMGGAGYVFSGEHDAAIMHNSAAINLNVADLCRLRNVERVFYSSSACIYPAYNQNNPNSPTCQETSAYPAEPDSEYGWEKLFSERLWLAYSRNYGMASRIARYHNIFGPEGAWSGGREKAPAAICRKVAMAANHGEIEIWGDGTQTRSFLFIDECIEGTTRLMRSAYTQPVNIGSAEMVSINRLVDMVCDIAGKALHKKHIPGPTGVRGRTSDNRLIERELGWKPTAPLYSGLEKTFEWIESQIRRSSTAARHPVAARSIPSFKPIARMPERIRTIGPTER